MGKFTFSSYFSCFSFLQISKIWVVKWYMANFHRHLKRMKCQNNRVLQIFVRLLFYLIKMLSSSTKWFLFFNQVLLYISTGPVANPNSSVCPKLQAWEDLPALHFLFGNFIAKYIFSNYTFFFFLYWSIPFLWHILFLKFH